MYANRITQYIDYADAETEGESVDHPRPGFASYPAFMKMGASSQQLAMQHQLYTAARNAAERNASPAGRLRGLMSE